MHVTSLTRYKQQQGSSVGRRKGVGFEQEHPVYPSQKKKSIFFLKWHVLVYFESYFKVNV